jgi:hypothetical protein
MCSESDTLSSRENYNQLVHNLEISDRSRWHQETDPCFGDTQVCGLVKELKMSVVQPMDFMNTLLVEIVTIFLVNFSHLQQLLTYL